MAPFTLGVETVCQVCEPAAEYTGHVAESSYYLPQCLQVRVCAVQFRINQSG